MPRTKINRKVLPKRNRRSSTEEKLEAKLREFDMLVDGFTNDTECQFSEAISKIENLMHGLRAKTPLNVLQMKWKDVKEAEGKTLADINKTHNATNMNGTSTSTLASLSTIAEEMRKSKKVGHSHDEGYLTEDGTHSNRSSHDQGALITNNCSSARPMGPLASAVAKARRASRSADPPVSRTPMIGSSLMMSSKAKARATPLLQSQSQHASRSKYRTPMQPRATASSVDRVYGLITPKVQPNMPLAILRRAKVGETVFSVTGSPVITAAAVENMANVNIPVQNGVLSIRPTEMNSVDPSIVNKFDDVTIEQLKTLQQNLNLIMECAERTNFRMTKK
uniref:CSON008238 protein n=1 Tax=Culicoides sonorensis TaxID=179676 RepID=A0A336LFA5_CULSO